MYNSNNQNQFTGQYGQFTSGLQQSMLNMQAQGQYLQSGFPYQSNPQFQTNPMMGINSNNPMMGAVGQPMQGIRSSQPLQPTMYPNAVSPPGSGSQGGGQRFANTTYQVPPPNMPIGMPYPQQQQPVNHLYPSIRKNSTNTIPFQGAGGAVNGSPVNKPQYHIPSNQKEKYANIYALLYTIDELQSCYCSGRVSDDEYSKKIENFLKQFETARNPLNLSNDDIERFTKAFDMNVSYALDVIKNPITPTMPSQNNSAGGYYPPTDNSSIGDYFALGGNFTTLSDCCVMEGLEAKEFQELLSVMRGRFQNIGVYQRNQKVKEYTDKWIDIFSKLKSTDIVSQELKDQLQADIVPWRDAFSSA